MIQFSHLAWTKLPRSEGGLGEMHIPLVADITKQISRDYGVLLEVRPGDSSTSHEGK